MQPSYAATQTVISMALKYCQGSELGQCFYRKGMWSPEVDWADVCEQFNKIDGCTANDVGELVYFKQNKGGL